MASSHQWALPVPVLAHVALPLKRSDSTGTPANAKCADPASRGTDATEDWAPRAKRRRAFFAGRAADAVAPLALGPARVLVDPVVPQTLCLMDPIGGMLPHVSQSRPPDPRRSPFTTLMPRQGADRLASRPSTERHLITKGAILERMRWWFSTDSSKPHNGANACDEASWKVSLSSTVLARLWISCKMGDIIGGVGGAGGSGRVGGDGGEGAGPKIQIGPDDRSKTGNISDSRKNRW
ncbi:hypothetical protein B0H13DRAFT_1854713 [Mycena leptocephala]|nr:hypothetical protein B0H13DRAFT_1854713 [Mycena leptocephala]